MTLKQQNAAVMASATQKPNTSKTAERPLISIAKHTRNVALIKRSLLGIALTLAVVLILWPQFRPIEKQLKLSFTKITAAESGKPQMLNPKFQGVDEHGQPYKIYADTATQESEQHVALSKISGDITLQDNGWIKFSADKGLVNLKKSEALLTGNVHITSSNQYDLQTQSVEVLLKKGIASGHETVIIKGPFATLEATGFILDNNAKTVVFTGPVKAILQPRKEGM